MSESVLLSSVLCVCVCGVCVCVCVCAGFLVYVAFVLVLCAVLVLYCCPRFGQSNILVYISICSLLGTFTVSSVKGLAIAINTGK